MKESVVYPGEYTMLPAIEELLHHEGPGHEFGTMKPRITMADKDDCVEIDVHLPAVNREDLFVYAHGNMLSLAILTRNVNIDKSRNLHYRKADTICMRRHIPLPDNADPEFMSAEFRQGILHICIPKTIVKPSFVERQIVVY